MTNPLLAISMGCPGGIGPEVALRALAARSIGVVFGDLTLMQERAPIVGLEPARVVRVTSLAQVRLLPRGSIAVVQVGAPLSEDARRPGRSTIEGGRAQLSYVDAACDAVVAGAAGALVTAPVSKEAIASAFKHGMATSSFGLDNNQGSSFRGHTEYLGERLGADETVMAFVADRLTMTLATTHIPHSAVSRMLRAEDVARAAYWTVKLVDELGDDPSLPVAVLALNPHAGEKGLLGTEERRVIEPGVNNARARLSAEGRARAVVGPLPAESAIRQAKNGQYAACVAMYHDQATIPTKLVAFGEAVNVTLGLPIVRTSVDHGTAYDLAGTGRADASGMSAALELAIKLARSRATARAIEKRQASAPGSSGY